MSRLNNNPFLQFDFEVDYMKPVIFTEPIDIIAAYQMNEVNKCLSEVEKAIEHNYYAAGFISYEAMYALQRQSSMENHKPSSMPLVWFGIFKEPSSSISYPKKSYEISEWQLSQSEHTYKDTFQEIMKKIHSKKIEQINYTVPFFAKFSGDAYTYYEQLKRNQKSSYSAFLQIDHFHILSISPELFFHLEDGNITVKPMKGTIHRGKTYQEDLRLKQWLASSEKNILENKMITELMKQELASIVENSSIQVMEPYKVEAYPTVYQMTSRLTGKVKNELSIIDIFKALFPSGSITGIPKQKAIEYIARFEQYHRGVYCGAIGYITPEQKAIFNVPIRTVIIDGSNNVATFGAGSAITENSHAQEEYEEVLTKANVLQTKFEPFKLLETIGLYQGKLIVLDEHLERLQQSATYFGFHIDIDSMEHKLHNIATKYPSGNWRIRLVVQENGSFDITVNALANSTSSMVKLAQYPIDKENIFHYHKTTNRKIYEIHLENAGEVFDVLLWNEQEEITEFTIGNVVVELEGKLYTPPVECGLLGGTYRASLLKNGEIIERKIHKEELEKCTNIYLINSVRKWVPVQLLLDK